MENISKIFNLNTKKGFTKKTEEELKFEFENQCLIAKRLNSEVGYEHHIDGLNCPICKNRGFSFEVVSNELERTDSHGLPFTEKEYITKIKFCSCHKERQFIRQALKNGFSLQDLKTTIDDFKIENEQSKAIKEIITSFIKQHLFDNTSLMLCGVSGSGKTMSAIIVCNALAKVGNVKNIRMVSWLEFIGELKRLIMNKEDELKLVQPKLDELKQTPILFIDDVFKYVNEADKKYLYEIIDYRYQHDLKTIVTSEKQLKELLQIDQATFGRIIEMCDEGEFVLNCTPGQNNNYRLNKAKIKNV